MLVLLAGNKYGEPVVCGFARSFGLQVPCLQPADTVRSIPADASGSSGSSMRVEWLKPVMFTAGVGWLDDAHKDKGVAAVDMLVCKMGGPAYRIGIVLLLTCPYYRYNSILIYVCVW